MNKPILISPAAVGPVTLADARKQVRVDDGVTIEDDLLARAILAATRMAEHKIARALIDRTWLLTMPSFQTPIDLQMIGVRSISTVVYDSEITADIALDAAEYELLQGVVNSELHAVTAWPAGSNVRITFVQGYGPAPEDMPSEVQNWILLQVGAFMRNREAFVAGQSVAEIPNRWVESLLDPERNYTIA